MVCTLWLLLGTSCTDGSVDSAAPTETAATETAATIEPETGLDTATGEDTATSGDTGVVWRCPQDMVPVGGSPSLAPAYCIDPYESTLLGELGSPDQYTTRDDPTTATALSIEGEIPDTLVSFGQASAVCANTAALDGQGDPIGFKRLPTAAEWEDAADGTVGVGGSVYSYGDAWRDDACATPTADGTVVLDGLQPTGSFPDCISEFGAFDMVGNAWEWTDSGLVLDIQAWLGVALALALPIVIQDNQEILADEHSLGHLVLAMQGLLIDTAPTVDSDGRLILDGDRFDPGALGIRFSGYLILVDDQGLELSYLPVWFDIDALSPEDPGPTEPQAMLVLESAEGAKIPDKRGCAYYTGSEYGCQVNLANRDHMHDFAGTISFRCVADPIMGDAAR
jgi:hypothetical protein